MQAGAATADAPQFAENAALGSDVDDYFAYNGGIALSYLGWDIAASFAVVEEPLCLLFTATAVFPPGLCASSNEGDSFNIGVGYSTGPWQLTLSYFVGQEEGLRDFPGLGNQGDEKSRFGRTRRELSDRSWTEYQSRRPSAPRSTTISPGRAATTTASRSSGAFTPDSNCGLRAEFC